MRGYELCARFSYITNSLRYCGPKEAAKEFLKLFDGAGDAETIEAQLKRFEGILPYLSVIAKANDISDPLDVRVVEAYWLGNELLDACTDEDVKQIIDNLVERGLPKSLGEVCKQKLPEGMPPHHNFNVMGVGVGRLTGSVATNLENMDHCRISWGRIVDIGPTLTVMTRPLIEKEGRLTIGNEEAKTAAYLPSMLAGAKKGDVVALHWGFACMVLSNVQQANLKKYTGRILSLL